MLPVYIGSFRFRDRAWRVLLNAQTGKLVGKAPIDRRKVLALLVVALVMVALALLWSRV